MRMLIATFLAMLIPGSDASFGAQITYQFWGSPKEVEVWNTVARAFEEEHQNIKVKIEASDWDSYWQKLKVKVAGGSAPDVFAMDAPLYKDWQSRGALLNLQSYLDAEPGILDDVYRLTLAAYETPDGFYGLPRDFQTIVLYYNMDMFDEAGVSYPSDSWTWEDFRAAAKELTKDKDGDGKTDQWGFWESGYDMEPFWGPLVWSFGGDVVRPVTAETLISSPQAVAAFQLMADMWLKDKSMPSEQQLRQYGNDGFFAGIAAMGLSGHWTVPEYRLVNFKWNIAPIPEGPAGRVTLANSAGLVIAKDSKYPDEAWEFVKFAFGERGQIELAKIGLSIPVRKSIAQSRAYLDQPVKIDQSLYIKALDYARMKPAFKGQEEWASAVGDALLTAWSGESNIIDQLAEAVANGNDVLARNR